MTTPQDDPRRGEPPPPAASIPPADPDPSLELAGRLAREFDAPIGLLDPAVPLWRVRIGAPIAEFPEPDLVSSPDESGRVALWRPDETGGRGRAWLILPVCPGGDRPMLALAGFATGEDGDGTQTGPWGPPCSDRALLTWGRSVAERMRDEAETRRGTGLSSRGETGPPAPSADGLIRRLRVSDSPARFQRLAARATREQLEASAVAWVPGHRNERVILDGESTWPTPEDCRRLVPESMRESACLIDEESPDGPRRIAVVAVSEREDETPAGWLLAVRRPGSGPFASHEVELVRSVASLIASQRTNARHYADLKDLLIGVIRALTSAIDAKDPYTSGHSERVARIAVRLGEELGMTANQRGDLYLMGLLHDVGKIGIEDGVLKKAGRLTPEEYRIIQSHVRIGVHILSDLKKLHHLLPGVAHHHECLDGSGYPDGLTGESIPMPARILAVADAFDAMSSSRPYRRRLSHEQIADIFRKGAGRQWDPHVVEALFLCLGDIEGITSKGLGNSLQVFVGTALGRMDN